MEPVVRLHLFFATENDRAVILRQGPSKHYRMILWHRDNDTFEDGQWLKHKIYEERCDLSPDGQHFIFFTLDGKWWNDTEGAYTVISKPPYFTALALFPEGSTWGGGGRFVDNHYYTAVGGHDLIGLDDGLFRLFRREPTTKCPSGLFKVDGSCAKLGKEKAALAASNDQPLSRTADLDRYDTQGGRLYRRTGGEMHLIRDFTDMTFEHIRAPYDERDNGHMETHKTTWHPLGDER